MTSNSAFLLLLLSTALWWSSMIITTMGSDYWPRSPKGRILTFLLALYAFAIFGYVTATIARFLIGRHTAETTTNEQFLRLEREIARLRTSLEEMKAGSYRESRGA